MVPSSLSLHGSLWCLPLMVPSDVSILHSLFMVPSDVSIHHSFKVPSDASVFTPSSWFPHASVFTPSSRFPLMPLSITPSWFCPSLFLASLWCLRLHSLFMVPWDSLDPHVTHACLMRWKLAVCTTILVSYMVFLFRIDGQVLCIDIQFHTETVYACLAVTCHLHFWYIDRGFLCLHFPHIISV